MQLRQKQKELESLNIKVVVVTFAADHFAKLYAKETSLDWPLLTDEGLTLYQAYGMHRGKWWQIYSPKTIWFYFSSLIRGDKIQAATEDTAQLGGDVLIDPQQVVRLHFVSENPASRPLVGEILRCHEV